MRLNSHSHSTEEYFCQTCDTFHNNIDVNNNWKCPDCKEYIEIRVITETLDNSCFRVPIKELEVDDMILIDRNDEFRLILNLKPDRNLIKVALQRYGTIPIPKDNLTLKLNGAWSH